MLTYIPTAFLFRVRDYHFRTYLFVVSNYFTHVIDLLLSTGTSKWMGMGGGRSLFLFWSSRRLLHCAPRRQWLSCHDTIRYLFVYTYLDIYRLIYFTMLHLVNFPDTYLQVSLATDVLPSLLPYLTHVLTFLPT